MATKSPAPVAPAAPPAPAAVEAPADEKTPRAKNYQSFTFAIVIHNDAIAAGMPGIDEILGKVCAEHELVVNVREGKTRTTFKIDTIETATAVQPTFLTREQMAKLRAMGMTADELLSRLGVQ